MLPYNWREKLSPAAIRDTVNANSKVVALVLIVVIVVALAYLIKSNFMRNTPVFSTKGYFIDEETGEVKVLEKSQHAPLLGASGKPTVVRVYYFTCTSCKERKPIYYEKFTDEAKAIIDRPDRNQWTPQDETIVRMGTMIRSPEPNSPWYNVMTKEANDIKARIECTTGNPQECDP